MLCLFGNGRRPVGVVVGDERLAPLLEWCELVDVRVFHRLGPRLRYGVVGWSQTVVGIHEDEVASQCRIECAGKPLAA